MMSAVERIAAGRLGIETDGSEHEGMVSFSQGARIADSLYAKAMKSADCELMIAAEYTYLSKELEYAEENEGGAEASAAALPVLVKGCNFL
jgi:hypothetical protein